MSARFPFYLLADSVDGMAKEAALSGKPSPAGPVTNDIPTARSSPSGNSNPLSSFFAAMMVSDPDRQLGELDASHVRAGGGAGEIRCGQHHTDGGESDGSRELCDVNCV